MEEAERALWREPSGAALLGIRRVWRRAGMLAGRRLPAEVRKDPTLEDAQAGRERRAAAGGTGRLRGEDLS